MELSKLLENVEVKKITGMINRNVSGIKANSKKVVPGDVFVALAGKKADGHNYIEEAINIGSTVIVCNETYTPIANNNVTFVTMDDTRAELHRLVSNFYGDPSKNFWLIGITGTNGKTSVSILANHVYSQLKYKTGVIGTIENYLNGKPMGIEKTTPTTPDCCELGLLMSQFRDNAVEKVLMEVSSMALKMHRVDSCRFDVAVYTNLSQDHLDDHVTMEDYKESKIKLFEFAPRAVINLDDKYANEFIKSAGSNVITYGIESDADVVAKNILYTANQVIFDVIVRGKYVNTIKLGVPSRFAVYNALAVIGICMWDDDISIDDTCEILSKECYIPGRYESVPLKNNRQAIIDFAHTPVALENLLDAVKDNPSFKRVITVFGCGGNRDATKRPIMGKISQIYSDFVIVTSDNPRNEDPELIIDDIMKGVELDKGNVLREVDRAKAIRYAYEMSSEGDVIVIAGKGHEKVQIIKGKNIPFSDKEVLCSIDKSVE